MGGTAHDEPATPRLSVLLGLAGLGVVAATVAVVLVAGNEEDRAPWVRAALVGWIILAYLTCGLIAWWRRPANRLGPLMVAAAFGPFLSVLNEASAPLPETLGEVLRMLPVALFLHVFLAYPTGRLERRGERIVVGSVYALVVGLGLVQMLLGGFGHYGVVNRPDAAEVVGAIQAVAVSTLALMAIGFLVLRRRVSGRPLRRSGELLVDSFVLALVLLAVAIVMRVFGLPGAEIAIVIVFAMIGVAPIAFLVGLLRARLGPRLGRRPHGRAGRGSVTRRPRRRARSSARRSVARARLLATGLRELRRPRRPSDAGRDRGRAHRNADRPRWRPNRRAAPRLCARRRAGTARLGDRGGRDRARERAAPVPSSVPGSTSSTARGPACSKPARRSGSDSSATCTTAPSSGSSRSPSSSGCSRRASPTIPKRRRSSTRRGARSHSLSRSSATWPEDFIRRWWAATVSRSASSRWSRRRRCPST